MQFIRPIPQRACHRLSRSRKVSTVETTGERPTGVSIHRRNPGRRSSMIPLTAGFFGPQQGGLSAVPSGGCIGRLSICSIRDVPDQKVFFSCSVAQCF